MQVDDGKVLISDADMEKAIRKFPAGKSRLTIKIPPADNLAVCAAGWFKTVNFFNFDLFGLAGSHSLINWASVF
jgi:hypothetical protein